MRWWLVSSFLLVTASRPPSVTLDQSAALVHYAKAQMARHLGDGERYLLELDQTTTLDRHTALPNQEYLALLKALGRSGDARRHLEDMMRP
ncbi:MAG: hypothetical protein VX405_06240 [Myxococcota bacterium]|nr:hypothetical protein [Myxococcales bacterium]MBF95406.1 hypothetical protein [Myxococcales bacterium]MEC7751083.1 hypothetical protein [Myxococcota bacterium]HBU46861.1 hypothetical protein [Myxococcales bacterium]|tara:strand:+ start:760 stop:1032 length:273 start_codon:yes stop_codon:yes gene_type:complete